MAKMIPATPRTHATESLENIMFEALEKKLPENYYVFHSLKIITVTDSVVKESETDFVIFCPDRGILCLEAKAGHVKYDGGTWRYGSGIEMSHDGPYNQAANSKYRLLDYIKGSSKELLKKCKMLHAVWFPSVSQRELRHEILPPESLIDITLTKEDLMDPLPSIERIFSMDLPNRIQTNLSEAESEQLLRKVLCPSFDLVPALSFEHDLKKQVFHKMLSEQTCVLNYLVEQKTAVIQGAAGTGKTLIALEKARRHAENGEKVLFLCYNKFLREFIASSCPHENIDFYTIDGFACKICNTGEPSYPLLKAKLEDFYLNEDFPYTHVIIDEGQDFGQSSIEENEIISLIENIIVDRENADGSFYVFYDAMQLVQGDCVPEYVINADCKLTLYKNCRNTENIATTSMKPIRARKPKLIEGCIKGSVPKMYFCEDPDAQRKQVEKIIQDYESKGVKDIVILTCKTETSSVLAQNIFDGKFNRKYRFTTCRKFKGLEADAIVITDLDDTVLTTNASKLFYVGSSRARLFLGIVCALTRDECVSVLDQYNVKSNVKNPARALATELNAIYVKVDE